MAFSEYPLNWESVQVGLVLYQRVDLSLQLIFIGYGLFVVLTMSIIVIPVSDSHLTTAPKDIMLTY